jgi:hypothetical protein
MYQGWLSHYFGTLTGIFLQWASAFPVVSACLGAHWGRQYRLPQLAVDVCLEEEESASSMHIPVKVVSLRLAGGVRLLGHNLESLVSPRRL